MPAPSKVHELIERFQRNKDVYTSGQYKEAQLRNEFLNPLFAELGWDVYNTAGYAELYKDVVHEASLRIEGAPKAPDYSFRIGGNPKFFVEAKKPSVNLREGIAAAFQLRRYGWTAGLPLSILTDFEEWASYDCRFRPEAEDGAATARVQYMTYEDYADRWDDIANVFSKEAILLGSFDKFADSTKKKRGTAEVDDDFLKEIERWREIFATDIASRNPDISSRELNYAVQLTIDRIVFLRIGEDRGTEEYGRLRQAAEGKGIYARLVNLFWHADQKYNSGLFYFSKEPGRSDGVDKLTPELEVSDDALRQVLEHLYFPDSPYAFKVLPTEILGQVYERFLGKTIRLTDDHEAVVEEKPEVRKAGGVYYTPSYVVDQIVERTLSPLLKDKKPDHVNNLKVLDPACGSGSFLLGAYKYLLGWHLQWYVDNRDNYKRKYRDRIREGPTGDWVLTTAERKRILLNNIHGVDIDAQAVEVTKLSLLLKVLEGETEETLGEQMRLFAERALPDLGSNIKSGNTLIESDVFDVEQEELFDEEIQYAVNAFDWEVEFEDVMNEGGWDAIIGNPPYDVLEKERGEASWPHSVLRDYVREHDKYCEALGFKLNLFRFFVVRSLDLLRQDGRWGMIIPLSLLADVSTRRTRLYLLTHATDLEADCFPQKDDPNRRIFRDAKLSTAVITGRKHETSEEEAVIHVRVYPSNRFEDEPREATVSLSDARLLDPNNAPIPLVAGENWDLCVRIHSHKAVERFGDVDDLLIRRGEVNQTTYKDFVTEDQNAERMIKGSEVARYHLQPPSQGEREWFAEGEFNREKQTWSEVDMRRIALQRISGVDEKWRLVGTIIEPRVFFADSTNSIGLKQGSNYDLRYVLALLNSPLLQWRFKLTSTNNNVATNELEALPFRTIDFGDPEEASNHDAVVGAVERILAAHSDRESARTAHDHAQAVRRLKAAEERIHRAVCSLYDLSSDDVKVIDQSMRRRGIHAQDVSAA